MVAKPAVTATRVRRWMSAISLAGRLATRRRRSDRHAAKVPATSATCGATTIPRSAGKNRSVEIPFE